MKHLFIINPISKRVKGKVKTVRDKITGFFKNYPEISYDIYESRWCRDAVTFIQSYLTAADERVRVHAIGGTGTFYEVVNGAVGFPNAETASHPYGKANSFLGYFGPKNLKHFLSLQNQVFSNAIPMDIIRCGNNYGICYGMTGVEAHANAMGETWIEKGVPADLSYTIAGAYQIMTRKGNQNYGIDIDGAEIEGDYASIMVANAPCYGVNMFPAVDAHPDSGMLDVYVFKNAPPIKLLSAIPIYTKGNYRKLPHLVTRYPAKKVKITSDKVMCMSFDGEIQYGTSIEYEIMPKAISFVCPEGAGPAGLPLIYGKPREGLR